MRPVGGGDHGERPSLLKDAAAHRLIAGDLEAVFLPGHGMLGSSLRHRGVELLRRVDDLETVAARGSTAGLPLLHPWANRLASMRYHVAGREVALDTSSPFLHYDKQGLPIHGIPWPRLTWQTVEARQDGLTARLDWTSDDLLAVFPFRHRLEMTTTLHTDGLTLDTTLVAGPNNPVPVSFGFHPYFGLPDLPRAQWRLELPAMRRVILDRHGIPTGKEQVFGGLATQLGEIDLDDGFALLDEPASLTLAGAGLRITVELLAGYRYAQVFAPKSKDYVALEPMTAPTSALTSGNGLRLVNPGGIFRAMFRINVEIGR